LGTRRRAEHCSYLAGARSSPAPVSLDSRLGMFRHVPLERRPA
jgi:hypothetical protein